MDRGTALALTVAAAALWGTSFPANDLGVAATDPWTFMAVRFAVGFATTALAALALRALDPAMLRNPWVWAVAGANAVSYQVQFLGQDLTTPGAAALMVNAGNLSIPLWAWLVHRERIAGAKGPALALGAAGVALVGTRGDLGALAGSEVLGNALALVAGLSFALVIVLQKGALDRTGRGDAGDARRMVGLVAWVLGLTLLLSLPGAVLFGSWALPPQALLAAGYTGFATTTLAFLLWSAALRGVSSVTSGLVLLLEIVVAFALSVALGLEPVGWAGLLGAGCVLGAVALVSLGPSSNAEPDPTTP